MKRTILAATVASVTILLCSCAPLPPFDRKPAAETTPMPPPPYITNHACIGSFVTPEGNFKGAGFELPIGKWAGGPMKIGSVQYDHSEAQKLSQAAQQAEQSRLTFCRATDPAVLSLLPAESRAEVIMAAIAGQTAIQANVNTFVIKVANASSPEEAVAAAAEMAQKVTKVEKDLINKAPDALGPKQTNATPYEQMPLWGTLVLMQANATNSFKQLSDKVDGLTDRLGASPSRSEIRVMGFNENGVSLIAAERQRLFIEFQEALGKIPESQRPIVFIVGYTNHSEVHLRNVNIGLQRAQVVRDFLQQQKFSRAYEGRVMSGKVDHSAYGRRVDLFVTGA